MRLIAYGCSHTYGAFLPDCINQLPYHAGPIPSSFAWPKLLADKLNMECINRAVCGASNKELWNRAVDYQYQKHDIVVFLWSYFERSCKLSRNGCEQFIGSIDKKISQQYYKSFYNEYDAFLDFFLRFDHIKKFLDNQGIINCHATVETLSRRVIPKWSNKEILDIRFRNLNECYPKAADNRHPGAKAHEKIAEIFYKYVKP